VNPSDLVRGLIGLKSLESSRELEDLSVGAAELGQDVCAVLSEGDEQSIRLVLSSSAEGRALATRVDDFLDRYGFLSAIGTDLSRTPWIEGPKLIWQAIGRAAMSPAKPDAVDIEAIREEAVRRVRAEAGLVRRFLFDRLLRSTKVYIDLRERTSFLISEDSFEMRRVFLALADQLVDQGALHHRDDVFYLYRDEVRDLVNGLLALKAAQRMIGERRDELDADATVELPDTICGDHVPTSPIELAQGQEYLVGIGGSSGTAQGYARVVLDPAQAPRSMTRDDILVVPFADMSWTPLFSGVGGVIAETGGQLSHSAIVAREYGLPAVVNVKHATRLIREGQRVTVDGTGGQVYLG